jgi:hypothetical protein
MKNTNKHNEQEHKRHKIYPEVGSHHQGALLPVDAPTKSRVSFNPNPPFADHKDQAHTLIFAQMSG